METHGLEDISDNYLLVSVKIGNKLLTALLDSGAQPTVIKLSCVPSSIPIVKEQIAIKGVKGPRVSVYGMAEIPIEVGNCIFKQKCIVVKDDQIDFPANADIIMGANFIILNNLDISSSEWALKKDGKVLEHFFPTLVDGKVFSRAELDYIHSSDLCEPELDLD